MRVRQGKPHGGERTRTRQARRGVGLADLLVSTAVMAILGGAVLVVVSQTRSTARSSECLSNLHHISTAFTAYAADSNGHYPDPLSAGRSWESMLSGYIQQPMAFACPADGEIFPSVGSSYDWRDTPDPLSTLAGKRLIDARPNAVLAFDTLPGWHAQHRMNVVLCDGSVLSMPDDAGLKDLSLPVNAGTRTSLNGF